MKLNRIVGVGLIVACLAITGNATEVGSDWYRCKIDYVGVAFGSSVMYLTSTDGKFQGQVKVKLEDSFQKEMLATALTARSIGADIFCWILKPQSAGGVTVNIGGENHQMAYAVGPVPE